MIGRICGTGSYIPSHRMDNVELSSLVDTSDEWIRERTGIQSRHLAKQETVSFMAAKAAEEALADSGLKAEEVEGKKPESIHQPSDKERWKEFVEKYYSNIRHSFFCERNKSFNIFKI